MVREFYANIEKKEGNFILVWGKRVSSNHIIINEFFDLNDLKTPKYNAIMNEEFNT